MLLFEIPAQADIFCPPLAQAAYVQSVGADMILYVKKGYSLITLSPYSSECQEALKQRRDAIQVIDLYRVARSPKIFL